MNALFYNGRSMGWFAIFFEKNRSMSADIFRFLVLPPDRLIG